MRILIADDHELVSKGVCALLAPRKDIQVIDNAFDGKQAVDKARQENPDLIILDISMPVLDGFGAASQIRRFLPTVPILFLSMFAGASVVEQAKSVGAQGFVRKDEAGQVLLRAVDSLIQRRTFFPGQPDSGPGKYVSGTT